MLFALEDDLSVCCCPQSSRARCLSSSGWPTGRGPAGDAVCPLQGSSSGPRGPRPWHPPDGSGCFDPWERWSDARRGNEEVMTACKCLARGYTRQTLTDG